jgi:putative cardiolipin synthase
MRVLLFFLLITFAMPCVAKDAECRKTPPQIKDNIFFHTSHDVHLLRIIDDGSAALQMRLNMIKRAQCFIDLEYIIYMPDQVGRIVAQALIQKKKEMPEIRIRFLLDSPPPVWMVLDAYHVSAMIQNGIEVHYYNAGWNPFNLTHRNHRKLLITEQEAISGGRNIANHYFDLDSRHNFADRDLWIKGRGIEAMEAVFEKFWTSKRTKPVVPILPPKFEDFASQPVQYDTSGNIISYNGMRYDVRRFQGAWRKYSQKSAAATDFITPNATDSTILAEVQRIGAQQLDAEPIYPASHISFISDKPDWKEKSSNLTGSTAYPFMNSAQETVFIENGYFMPQRKEREVLRNMLEDGKNITLLTNSRYDINEFLANTITLWRSKAMMKYGMKVYLYTGTRQPDVLPIPEYAFSATWNTHAKTILVDEKDAWIGTMNFDPRSIRRLNAEMAVIVHDNPEFAKNLMMHFEERIQQAYPMDPTERDPRSRREKLQTFKQWLAVLVVHFGLTFAETQF